MNDLCVCRMANKFPEIVGEVDVISDGENIKRLLKVPFAKSRLSMMIHRVDKTLLIDDFDLSRLILNEQRQWRWLKSFLVEQMKMQDDYKNIVCRKNTSRSYLQSQNMLRKFLQYSVLDAKEDEVIDELDGSVIEECLMGDKEYDKISSQTSTPEVPDSPIPCETGKPEIWSLDISSDHLDRELDLLEGETPVDDNKSKDFNSHLRDILWTFENIQMLVGSDMPIFGDAEHPAVSLRLRESNKPINVLTGLDYWLDNLMCSVPEVVMCYHLDGIVKRYELLKTEEIPQMQNSRFSPKVVRDIAQNILTFLKSKATKSGHTYWLLKSKEGDVVKLYDLTTLCENYFDEDSQNPYALPVAMLLYRVAKRLYDEGAKRNHRMYNLLSNCLSLIDVKKHKKIAVSAQYLLAEVLLPSDIDPNISVSSPDELSESDEDFNESQSNTEESSDESCASLHIKELTKPKIFSRKRTKLKRSNCQDSIMFTSWEKRGLEALEYIVQGLTNLGGDLVCQPTSTVLRTDPDGPLIAKPHEPIPMPYSSLSEDKKCTELIKACDDKQITASRDDKLDWQHCQTVLLLQKSAQIYCVFSDLAINQNAYRRALKFIKLGFLCYETAKNILPESENEHLGDIIPCLLGLCGDCHYFLLKNEERFNEKDGSRVEFEESFVKICDNYVSNIDKYSWCFNSTVNIDNNAEERLKLSARCYEEALTVIENSKVAQVTTPKRDELMNKVKRKLGNVCNELSCLYMSQVTTMYEEAKEKDKSLYSKLESLTKTSLNYLKRGIQALDSINDVVNCISLYCNTGRLMRICAHVFSPTQESGQRSEVTAREKHFYTKAIDYYQEAFRKLTFLVASSGDGNLEHKHIWDRLNWDLCTTLFTIGCLLQDHPPIAYCAFEEIERDIYNYLSRALQLCVNAEEKCCDQIIRYQYRAATINHKLASLFHHSFRNLIETDPKRKKIFQQADSYYEEAEKRFFMLESKKEYLSTLLERNGMHERLSSMCSGFGSRLKALQTTFALLINAGKSTKLETNPEDVTEVVNMLNLVCERLHICVKDLLKLYSTKSSKYKENVKRWKELDGQLSSPALRKILAKKPISLTNLENYVWNLCEKCSKVLTFELRKEK